MTRTFRSLVRAISVAVAAVFSLIFSTSAQAATLDQWDRLAQCESSGNWQANTGNGYYGGLQFSRRTWTGHGGGAYASTANHATRSQQIAIAEKVLRTQGWKAWPACSRRIGVR
ncbi:MAG: transglycosylase family protein [Pseudonocardiaceae bacterium]